MKLHILKSWLLRSEIDVTKNVKCIEKEKKTYNRRRFQIVPARENIPIPEFREK